MCLPTCLPGITAHEKFPRPSAPNLHTGRDLKLEVVKGLGTWLDTCLSVFVARSLL